MPRDDPNAIPNLMAKLRASIALAVRTGSTSKLQYRNTSEQYGTHTQNQK
jgi:hypothetical protein